MKKRISGIVVGLGCLMLASLVFQESSFAQTRDKEAAVVKYEKYEYGAKRQWYTEALVKAVKEVSGHNPDLVSVDIFLPENKKKRDGYKRILIPCQAIMFSPGMYEGMTDYVQSGGLLITNIASAIIDANGNYKQDTGDTTFNKRKGNPLVGVYGTSSVSITKINVESACPLTEGIQAGEWTTLGSRVAGRTATNKSATVLITSDSIYKGNPSKNQPFLTYKHLGEGACIYVVPIITTKSKYISLILKNALSEKTLNWLTAGISILVREKREKDTQLSAVRVKQKVEHDVLKSAKTDWFDEDLIRCTYLERPPIEKLGGRFYLIARVEFVNQFGYERTRQNMRQLKLMGITDIIQRTIAANIVFHPTSNPDALCQYGKDYDPLMTLVEAASKEGINVWVKLQLATGGTNKVRKNMHAYDRHGQPYDCGKKRSIPDVLSPAYRNFVHSMIDEYASKYNKYGNLKGLYIDMPYSNVHDYFGDDIEAFNKFSIENFGEPLPDNIGEKLDKKGKWSDPNDKWWRRFVLFKQWASEDFIRDIASYNHKKGFEFALQVESPAKYWKGWRYGHDSYRLSKLAKWMFTYPGADTGEPIYIYNHSTVGTFYGKDWGKLHTQSFRGNEAGLHFPFVSLWKYIVYGSTARSIHELKKHIINCREWAGAESLTKIAVLHNQRNLLLRLEDTRGENNSEIEVFKRLSYYHDADRLFVEEVPFYKRYSVLIAPQYSVGSLSKEIMDGLKKYVAEGGTVISLNAQWSVSKRDLTGEKDLTLEITGVPYNTAQKPGAFSEKGLDYVETSLGKGRIISINSIDVAEELKKGNKKLEQQFVALVEKYTNPEIRIENNENAEIRIMTTLKKNNWVAVSLYSEDQTPAKAKVYVDLKRLGLDKSGYRLLLLGRGAELLKPGDYKGGTRGKSNFWTAENFKKGIDITILKDNDIDLELPVKLKVSDYKKEAKWLEVLTKRLWDRGQRGRHYEYEIMVIAPSDELTIEGEKTK